MGSHPPSEGILSYYLVDGKIAAPARLDDSDVESFDGDPVEP